MLQSESAFVEAQGFHEFKRKSNCSDFPEKFYDYVRSFGKVYFWSQGNFHVVTDARYGMRALKNPALSCDRSSFFMSRMPNLDLALIRDFFAVVSKMMVMSDGADHKKRRLCASRGLGVGRVSLYAERIKTIVAELISQRSEGGEIDFARDIARQIPSIVLADLFSIPESDRSDFYEWSNTMTAFFGGGSGYENKDGEKVNAAAINLRSYFKDLIGRRRKLPLPDLFTDMLTVSDSMGLSEEELISQGIMMLVAGQVTTSDQMCNILYLLLKDPLLLSKVQKDLGILPHVIEELKRLDPAVTFLFRVAKENTYIGPQVIKEGDTVFISSHCINRDSQMFKNPSAVDLARKNSHHFSYGHGAHHCLGAQLARLEMLKLFELLIHEYPDISFGSASCERDHYSLSFSGFKSLPVRLGKGVSL